MIFVNNINMIPFVLFLSENLGFYLMKLNSCRSFLTALWQMEEL